MARYVKGAAQASLALQLLIAGCTIWWLLYWLLEPIRPVYRNFLDNIDNAVNSSFVGTRDYARTDGSTFVLQALPFMVAAFLSYFVIELRRRTKPSASAQKPKINIWTLPIFVRSPLGMLTLGDLIFIMTVVFITFWFLIYVSVARAMRIDGSPTEPGDPAKWVEKLGTVGVTMGSASLIPFALLWIPVSRGSPLLRLIEVPFEHAVRHHIWLGSLTVWLATGHAILLIYYYVHNHSGSEVLTWDPRSTAYIAGVIAWVSGVFMLVTALDVVRRRFFDLFFRVHHLYFAYLFFFAFHAVYDMYILIIPVLLFFLDRFFRFVQSRKAVDVLSAKVLPSGAIELRFAKPESLTYHALSFLYVLLPSVSRLEWHPFSVASSPLDGKNEISIYIKPLGGFTKNLHDVLIASKQTESTRLGRQHFKCPFSFKVGLEGPYGDESSFYLRYQSLVMIAGGIGVTPFLAILQDILHRYRLGEDDLPTSIHLIFCCRHASELHILDTLAPNDILPSYEEHLKIKCSAFVTSKYPDGATEDDQTGTEMVPKQNFSVSVDDPRLQAKGSEHTVREMSPITSTGHTVWVCAAVSATLLGFFVTFGIFNVTVIKNPNSFNYPEAFIFGLCMFLAVVPCGGGVLLLWALVSKRALSKTDSRVMSHMSKVPSPSRENDVEDVAAVDGISIWQENLISGRRPNWNDMFNEVKTEYDGQNVGVMVSGAHYMQQDVARQCKRLSLSRESTIMLHYHSVSFEL